MMRVNPIGWSIFAFFFVAGIVLTVTDPEGETLIGPIWVAVSLVLLTVYLWMGRSARKAEQLKREGIPGQAQVLEMTQTGVYVNEQPRVRLKLRVEAPGVTPFEDEDTHTVGLIFLGMLAPGRPLPVYVDRQDHSNFMIDWGGTGAGPAPATLSYQGGAPVDLNANPEAREAVMDTLRRHGIDTQGAVDLRQHPAARAAVLQALERHGVDVAHGAAAPAAPVEQPGEPLDRLQKLLELKIARVITEEEYEEQKARILKDI